MPGRRVLAAVAVLGLAVAGAGCGDGGDRPRPAASFRPSTTGTTSDPIDSAVAETPEADSADPEPSPPEPAPPAVSGLVERSRPRPAVVVEDVTGNVIFTLHLHTDERPVIRLREGRASVPVTITADRCDSHAVAEFKRPFTFLGWFGIGGGEPTPVELEVTGSARDALADLLASC